MRGSAACCGGDSAGLSGGHRAQGSGLKRTKARVRGTAALLRTAGGRSRVAIVGRPRFGRLLLGGAAGLALHESGHLVADWAFEEKVVVKKVD